jgi:hypothetical protein
MLTMRPPSASSGSSAWVRKYGPFTWTAKTWSNSASVVSFRGLYRPVPALLTRMSKVPSGSLPRRVSTKAPKEATSVVSSFSADARRPPDSISATTSWASASLLL